MRLISIRHDGVIIFTSLKDKPRCQPYYIGIRTDKTHIESDRAQLYRSMQVHVARAALPPEPPIFLRALRPSTYPKYFSCENQVSDLLYFAQIGRRVFNYEVMLNKLYDYLNYIIIMHLTNNVLF